MSANTQRKQVTFQLKSLLDFGPGSRSTAIAAGSGRLGLWREGGSEGGRGGRGGRE